jgi:hypothetical protein
MDEIGAGCSYLPRCRKSYESNAGRSSKPAQRRQELAACCGIVVLPTLSSWALCRVWSRTSHRTGRPWCCPCSAPPTTLSPCSASLAPGCYQSTCCSLLTSTLAAATSGVGASRTPMLKFADLGGADGAHRNEALLKRTSRLCHRNFNRIWTTRLVISTLYYETVQKRIILNLHVSYA